MYMLIKMGIYSCKYFYQMAKRPAEDQIDQGKSLPAVRRLWTKSLALGD